jgi:PIN domain nuclease of toxin-antitoxin system
MTVLVDTCVLIAITQNSDILPAARTAIDEARLKSAVLVSPVSAWELGLLFFKTKNYDAVFKPNIHMWFASFMQVKGIAPAHFDARIALDSTCLPGTFHQDPADRFLVATARHLNVPLVTNDRKILNYAAAGYVQAIAC